MLGPGPANGDSFLGRREKTPKFRSQAEPPLTRAIAPHCGPLDTQLVQKVLMCACRHAGTTETRPEAKSESTVPSGLQKGPRVPPGPAALCSSETCLPDCGPRCPECDAVFAAILKLQERFMAFTRLTGGAVTQAVSGPPGAWLL